MSVIFLIISLCVLIALFIMVVALWLNNERLRDQSARDAAIITSLQGANALLEKQIISLTASATAEEERYLRYEVSDHRQSRWLEFMDRSKRLFRAPNGGNFYQSWSKRLSWS
ncbi:MAG: hypothetical protein AAF702_49705 [Chloroflexota bacterium]